MKALGLLGLMIVKKPVLIVTICVIGEHVT